MWSGGVLQNGCNKQERKQCCFQRTSIHPFCNTPMLHWRAVFNRVLPETETLPVQGVATLYFQNSRTAIMWSPPETKNTPRMSITSDKKLPISGARKMIRLARKVLAAMKLGLRSGGHTESSVSKNDRSMPVTKNPWMMETKGSHF